MINFTDYERNVKIHLYSVKKFLNEFFYYLCSKVKESDFLFNFNCQHTKIIDSKILIIIDLHVLQLLIFKTNVF